MDLKWKAGAAKSKILTYPENQVMLGYAHPSRNYVRGVKTPLFVRCLTLELENNYLILINYETGFITEALRRELSQRIINTFSSLNLSFDNILISAQHTHSAPSGYDEYFYYSIPGKGFYPEYLEVLVKHGLEAVSKALESHDERDLYWIRKDLPADLAIARNRAMKSWRRNTNVDKSKNEVSAFDRRMGILGFYNEKQEPTAFWNWFACHATCLGNKNTLISSDNKGYASIHHENKFNNQFVSVFAQGSAGDVSPNFIHSKKKRHGFLNDFDHVRDNGQKHLDAFEHIISLEKTAIIPSVLKSEAFFVDMSAGDERRQSFVGVSMLRGAKEGRGMPDFFYYCIYFMASFVHLLKKKNSVQGVKKIILSYNGKLLNLFSLKNNRFLARFDLILKNIYELSLVHAVDDSWMNEVLPFSLSRVGQLVLVSLPFETTSEAGIRIEKAILNSLNSFGVNDVQLNPYTNGYYGYLVTPEEYDEQDYEGGHCLFGKDTLNFVIERLDEMCIEFVKPLSEEKKYKNLRPRVVDKEKLKRRTYKINKWIEVKNE